MARSRNFLYVIIIFYLYDICDAKFEKNMIFNKININGTVFDQFKIGNIRFKDNYMFCSFPRKDNTNLSATFAFTNSSNEEVKIFEPYPNISINEYKEGKCENLLSVISFEIDHEGKIYLLDEGFYKNGIFICPPKLIIYKEKQEIDKYYFYIENKTDIQLEDFLIDKAKNYIYIIYHDYNASGIFLIYLDTNHKNNIIKKLLYNDEKLKEENGYILKINGEILKEEFNKTKSIGLSCDGEAFFFSFISSKMIYSMLTKEIYQQFKNSEKDTIGNITIYEAYKNDATSIIIYSNMGNLFLAGLEKNKVYSYDLIDNDLSRFDYKGLRELDTNKENIIFPYKMTFYNGKLYLLTKDLKKNIYKIYSDTINEKSYIYGCAGLKYQFNLSFYIMLGIFFLILLFVLTFVIAGNIQDKDINKKNN